MRVEIPMKLASMKHFRSKPEKGSQDYYLLHCLMEREVQDENAQGYEIVSVYTDEAHYNALLNTFKPLMDISVFCDILGSSVRFSLI